jgi:hypothetical protein
MYAVVLFTSSPCAAYPGKSCVMEVIGPVAGRSRAQEIQAHYLEHAPWTSPHVMPFTSPEELEF